MAELSEVTTLVLDLAVLLKAFRSVQQEAAQVGTQLAAQLQACQALDARAAQTVEEAVAQAAQTLTRTVQQGTVALQDGQRQAVEQVGAAVQRQHATLLQEWQRVVAQATRARHWVPWQLGAVLVLMLLLVNGGGWSGGAGSRRRSGRRCSRRSGWRRGSISTSSRASTRSSPRRSSARSTRCITRRRSPRPVRGAGKPASWGVPPPLCGARPRRSGAGTRRL